MLIKRAESGHGNIRGYFIVILLTSSLKWAGVDLAPAELTPGVEKGRGCDSVLDFNGSQCYRIVCKNMCACHTSASNPSLSPTPPKKKNNIRVLFNLEGSTVTRKLLQLWPLRKTGVQVPDLLPYHPKCDGGLCTASCLNILPRPDLGPIGLAPRLPAALQRPWSCAQGQGAAPPPLPFPLSPNPPACLCCGCQVNVLLSGLQILEEEPDSW